MNFSAANEIGRSEAKEHLASVGSNTDLVTLVWAIRKAAEDATSSEAAIKGRGIGFLFQVAEVATE